MSDASPNLFRAAISILGARRVPAPRPTGTGTVDHAGLAEILDALSDGGMPSLPGQRPALARYLDGLSAVDPDGLGRDEALAFWLNLYNASALDLAAETAARAADSVLRIPGAFSTPRVTVLGRRLSLDGIEHGKVRRFGDPRIHAALVCGSVSCPTLRREPYRGAGIEEQLDDQMQRILATGGAVVDRTGGTVSLSRLFRWYGADYTRPHRMPTLLPGRRRGIAVALTHWMTADDAAWVRETSPAVTFQDYDWTLACTVG